MIYKCPKCGIKSKKYSDIIKEDYIGDGETIYKCVNCEFKVGSNSPMGGQFFIDSFIHSKKKYGLLLGRFQPFHKGHASIIDKIIEDGLIPIIIIGSINKIPDDKNPLTFEQRKEIIQKIYPNAIILGIKDFKSWDEWFNNIENQILMISPKEKIILYSHLKDIDKIDFEYKNKKFHGNYPIIFDLEGYHIKNIEEFTDNDKIIHAREIRKDKKLGEKYLFEETFKQLNKWKFWGEIIWQNNIDQKIYKIIEYTNFIKVYGGDGTMLLAIRKFSNKNKPFYGIGKGTINFLMNNEENVFNPEIVLLHLLKINYENNWHLAFNEICIGGDMSSWINFSINDKDEQIEDFKGSGVIISTAQGSTGISKNNGGVILPLTSNNWVITGDKTNRKIHYVLEPQNLIIKVKSRKSIYIWCDGKTFLELSKDKEHIIKIEQSDKIVQVMFNNVHEFKRKRK